MPANASPAAENLYDALCAALDEKGYAVLDAVLESGLAGRLVDTAQAIDASGAFIPAGTGRSTGRRLDSAVRSDGIHWLGADVPADREFLEFADALRHGLNKRLYLGLLAYEAHYARYAPGAFYAKHRDAFAGQRNRVLSSVFYLNRDWSELAGGELVLYDDTGEQILATVSPCFNRLILFFSERFPHEVKPATRTRYSVAGWFRLRS